MGKVKPGNISRGVFITFDGVEGCGKTTQMALLEKYLLDRRIEVMVTREPGGTRLGEKVRRILLDPENTEMVSETELFLYLADRAQHVSEKILPALDAGKVVLSDRHADASVAYQGYARDIGPEFVNKLNEFATGGLMPDLTIILDLPPADGLERAAQRQRGSGKSGAGSDRLESQRMEFHERVRAGYLDMAGHEPDRMKVVDASGTPEEVHRKVTTECAPVLERFLEGKRSSR
jgi:dTMP kinase